MREEASNHLPGPWLKTVVSDLRKFVMIKDATCANAIEAFAKTC